MQTKTVLIAILAVLSVALAGVLGWQKLSQPEITPVVVNQPPINQPAVNQSVANQPVVNQPVVKQPVATTSNETAGWKTYANQQYGFEIMYPSGWKFKESVSASGVWAVSFSDNQEADTTKIQLSITSDSLLRKKVGPAFSYKKMYDIDWVKQMYEEEPMASDISTSEINVNGLRALKHISYNPGNKTKRIQVSIPIVNKMLILVVQGIATSTTTFDQMLSTFKFTK